MANLKLTNSLGLLLLAIWLILTGIFALAGVISPMMRPLMGVLALVAGILIAIGR